MLSSAKLRHCRHWERLEEPVASSAAVEGKRHFRFSSLRVATGCRLCTHEKGHTELSPRVSILCPRVYGLIRSHLHAQGCCEFSSASTGFMSLHSGGRSEQGPHVGIPLKTFHSVTSVGLPPCLEGSAGSVALDSLYDPDRLHTPICSQPPISTVFFLTEGFYPAGKFRMLTLKSTLSQIPEGDWFVTVDLKGCPLPHPGSSEAQEIPQVSLQGKGLPVQGSSLWASSGPKDVHRVYECSSGPAEAPGHPNPQLPGRLVILASSREQVIRHRDSLLLHLRALGLWLNG